MYRTRTAVALLAALLLTSIASAQCTSDLNGDGSVGFVDLNAMLSAWGPCGACPEDLDGNDGVGFTDLNQLLSAWGPCPADCVLMNGFIVPHGWIGDDDCHVNCLCTDGELSCDNDEEIPICNVPCFIDGKWIPSGTPGVLIDDCNTCTCLHGELIDCSDLTCFAPCFFMGEPVPHGGMITGHCEICTCVHGVLDCDFSGCD